MRQVTVNRLNRRIYVRNNTSSSTIIALFSLKGLLMETLVVFNREVIMTSQFLFIQKGVDEQILKNGSRDTSLSSMLFRSSKKNEGIGKPLLELHSKI